MAGKRRESPTQAAQGRKEQLAVAAAAAACPALETAEEEGRRWYEKEAFMLQQQQQHTVTLYAHTCTKVLQGRDRQRAACPTPTKKES